MIFDGKPLFVPTAGLSENEVETLRQYAERWANKPLATFLMQRQELAHNLRSFGTTKPLIVARHVAHLAGLSFSSADRITVGSMILHDIGSVLNLGVQLQLATPESPAGQLRAYARHVWQAGLDFMAKHGAPDTQMAPNLAALASFYKLDDKSGSNEPPAAPPAENQAAAPSPDALSPDAEAARRRAEIKAKLRAGGFEGVEGGRIDPHLGMRNE